MYGRFYTILFQNPGESSWWDTYKELTAEDADAKLEHYKHLYPSRKWRKKCVYSGPMRFMAAR
jgi:hypothetical protein